MAIQKVDSYDEYQFSELGRDSSGKSSVEDVIEQRFDRDSANFTSLISEADRAQSSEFQIDEDVFELRKIKLAKKNELEAKIEERISDELNKIKEKAYQEGFNQGLNRGKRKAYQEERQRPNKKLTR